MENQMNYKTAYDLALQTGGENLPVTFKLGEEDNPTFYEFASMQQLQEFYTGAVKHIQETQKEGWELKKAIDWSVIRWSRKRKGGSGKYGSPFTLLVITYHQRRVFPLRVHLPEHVRKPLS